MRKLIGALCAALLVFSLCSCSAQNQKEDKHPQGGIIPNGDTSGDSNSNISGDTSGDSNSNISGDASGGSSSDTSVSSVDGLTMLCNGGTSQSYYNTESGYYYITEDISKLKDGTFSYHLMYVDFATQQEIYLCSNSGCQHDTQNCTAVLPMDDFEIDSRIFVYQNALYILSRQYDNAGSSFFMQGSDTASVENAPAVLYRIGLDGSNREKVYTFDSNLTLEAAVLADESGIYMITKKLESAQEGNYSYVTSSQRQIVRLDTSTWKAQTVRGVDFGYENTEWEIVGCYDSNIVVEGIVFETPLSYDQKMDESTYLDSYRNSKSIFATVDLVSGSFNEIHSVSNKNLHTAATQDGMLYLSLNTEDSIHRFNLRTGEKDVLATLKQNNIYQVLEGTLCTASWELTDDYGINFVDMKTGEVSRSDLVTKTLGWRLELRGETGEDVLLVYDYDAVAQNDGAYEINGYKLALIDKDDLYHGIDKFRPIQMVGKGY